MINKIAIFISKYIYIFFLKFNFRKTKNISFTDLNFKQNDFINYSLVKQYIFRDNFINNTTISDIHTFNFLYYFQKIGGENGINLSKKNIFMWFRKYKNYRNFPWSEDLTAKRFLNIIYNYDFICSIINKKDIKLIEHIIDFHKKRLLYDLNIKKIEEIRSTELVALVLIRCIYNNLNNYNFKKIQETINIQLDTIFFHKSYNILEHAKFLNNLNEIKSILLFFKTKYSNNLNDQIYGMTALIARYWHDDFSLPLFNGCNNNHNKTIQNIINNEKFLRSRNFDNLSNGIILYKDQKKTIFFDVIQPTNQGFSNELAAGSLSFEISSYGEKIITNCGGSESSGKNPSYLKYSAAHSTIIINNTNISEIKDGYKNKIFPKKVFFESNENENLINLTGSHNGYLKNYYKICKREISIYKKINLIKGQDTIISTKTIFDKNVYHIRFHLMPNISATITKNKKSIIIKTKKNNIWLFKSNSELSIENSIFVESDTTKESRQIVISGITSAIKNKISWTLEKI